MCVILTKLATVAYTERVLEVANALKDLVSHEQPNRDRKRVRWAIDRYLCEFPGVDLLYLLLVAPAPDYGPGYRLTGDGSIVDVAGQLAGRVAVQIMGSNALIRTFEQCWSEPVMTR